MRYVVVANLTSGGGPAANSSWFSSYLPEGEMPNQPSAARQDLGDVDDLDNDGRGRFAAMNDGVTTTQVPRLGVALLGGYRASGRLRLSDRLTRVSLLGGVDLDLSEAEFTDNRFTLVKVSLLGGVDLRVPAGSRVEVHGLSIGSRDLPGGTAEPDAPQIVIHSWGILGGVKVRSVPAS